MQEFFCFAILVNVILAHIAESQSVKKLWSIDLNTDSDYALRQNMHEGRLNTPGITFIDESHIVCDFYDNEHSIFNHDTHSHYHLLVINSKDGSFGKKIDLVSPHGYAKVAPTADQGFIVLNEGTVTKYDAELRSEANRKMAGDEDNDEQTIWRMDIAPAGKVALLYHQTAQISSEYLWISTHDLTTLQKQPTEPQFVIRASSTSAISFIYHSICPDNLCISVYLTDDLLFLNHLKTYTIQTLAGDIHAKGRVHETFDISRAMFATRLAFVDGNYQSMSPYGSSTISEQRVRVKIMDWTKNKVIAEFDMLDDEESEKYWSGLKQFSLALSPDGKYIAILMHHTLSYYKLP